MRVEFLSLNLNWKSRRGWPGWGCAPLGTCSSFFLILCYFIYLFFMSFFREQKNEKDHLYNDIIKVIQTNDVGFTKQQAGTVGVHVVQTLTSLFWYLDPFHERFNSRAVQLPDMFKDLKGYRQFKKQHKKVPQVCLLFCQMSSTTSRHQAILFKSIRLGKPLEGTLSLFQILPTTRFREL